MIKVKKIIRSGKSDGVTVFNASFNPAYAPMRAFLEKRININEKNINITV